MVVVAVFISSSRFGPMLSQISETPKIPLSRENRAKED